MIQKVWLKERTADSIPFMSAEEKCHLSQLGYAEDEYFFPEQPMFTMKRKIRFRM